MGHYRCRARILRLDGHGRAITRGELFSHDFPHEQEATLAAAGAIEVLEPSVSREASTVAWAPPAPGPDGPGDPPRAIVTPNATDDAFNTRTEP